MYDCSTAMRRESKEMEISVEPAVQECEACKNPKISRHPPGSQRSLTAKALQYASRFPETTGFVQQPAPGLDGDDAERGIHVLRVSHLGTPSNIDLSPWTASPCPHWHQTGFGDDSWL